MSVKRRMQEVGRQLYQKVRAIQENDFDLVALEVFRYQAKHNPVYAEYLKLLQLHPEEVQSVKEIPGLPIELFKNHEVKTGNWKEELLFSSSGTTGATPSRHFIRSSEWYRENAQRGFQTFYGDPSDYCFLALLPHYLDRKGSSLVQMVKDLMDLSNHPNNGFYLRNQKDLARQLQKCISANQPTILIGVSFALWEFAENFPMDLNGVVVMETGGMKGQRRELIRSELHAILSDAFQLEAIHSEYGMTELLSQAYSKGDGWFEPAPTMQIHLRDITDPFQAPAAGSQGQILVIDLANIDSCSFILTEDIGRKGAGQSFEVLGRLDRASWRGCNLMVLD